ncbi:MAG TPA: YbaB/EbfC family nucleoid-associated protein [Dehalococcoidia bacterium]|nr:YbaB/EbfC family nucleoid-associated protein [Dehalococcoidia bacterium]
MDHRILRQAQQLQEKLAKIQAELGNETVEVTSGGGAVTLVIDGHQRVRSITISREAVDPEDVEMLEDLILSAMNEALDKSRELASKRLGAITGGMKIPGLM